VIGVSALSFFSALTLLINGWEGHQQAPVRPNVLFHRTRPSV